MGREGNRDGDERGRGERNMKRGSEIWRYRDIRGYGGDMRRFEGIWRGYEEEESKSRRKTSEKGY